jgi:superoxide reductase
MMSERREFLKLVAAGPAGALLLPLFAETGRDTLAADVECAAGVLGKLPENIIYSKEHPGAWKGKEGSHIPSVEAKKSADGLTLTLQNKHGMSEQHYIVRHTVVAECGKVLGAKTFTWKDQPRSTHEIKLAAGEKYDHVFVLSYCNLHDLWLVHTELKV